MTHRSQFMKIPTGLFKMPQKCYVCHGTGLDLCPQCCGNKVFNGKPCTACDGRGVVKCYACGGTGLTD